LFEGVLPGCGGWVGGGGETWGGGGPRPKGGGGVFAPNLENKQRNKYLQN